MNLVLHYYDRFVKIEFVTHFQLISFSITIFLFLIFFCVCLYMCTFIFSFLHSGVKAYPAVCGIHCEADLIYISFLYLYVKVFQ